MNLILTIICTLVIFGVLITTHEFGHFIVARKCGVIVEEFSIGMGPLIFNKEGKDGTIYSIRLFPIGGFCRMYGEDEDENELGEGSLNSISPFKRILVLAAGAFMNLLTALVILIIIYAIVGTNPTTTLSGIMPNSPAYTAGLEVGDTITKVNNKEIHTWDEMSQQIVSSNGNVISITYTSKDNTVKQVDIKPYLDETSNTYKIGVNPKYERSIIGTIKTAIQAFFTYIYLIFDSIIGLIRGAIGINQLSGPIGVATIVNQAMSMGAVIVLNISALLAINLGIFNLLPIPALDGSRILFCIIEMIKGSPIDRKKEGTIHFIGFVLLMGLAIFVAMQDVIKLF